MNITVNGKSIEIEENANILQLLSRLDLHPQRVAVEVNRAIVKRGAYDSHTLTKGDEIEILQFVGGGA
ncbi:MAG: sulfur carrier protein ThiS [Candidatus Omnitrophota bacterium]